MRRYLLILLWLPLFGQVPNTTTFNFLDVKNEIESNGGATTNSLVDAFANANASGFDPAYEGSKNSLLNFRNYKHLQGFRPSGNDYDFTSQETGAWSVFFKSDGTKMYILGTGNDTVYAYTLSTAWDVSTASYGGENYDLAGNDARYVFFRSTGLKMYVMRSVTLGVFGIYQYTLSTAWDVSTASYDSKMMSISQGNNNTGMFFKSDGLKVYFINSNASVYAYTLSTAWDVSTASYGGENYDLSSQASVPQGVFFKSDGTKMFINNSFNSRIYQYTLSTAWDVSTASYDSEEYFYGSQLYGLYIKSDGLNFYSVSREVVYEYITDIPWSIED